MKYLPDAEWHHLIAKLIAAAHNTADPRLAVAELVSGYVAPESRRADIEADDRAIFARYGERETRAPSGRLDLDKLMADADVLPDNCRVDSAQDPSRAI